MQKVSTVKMRMLRWTCDKTRQDRIKNEHIRDNLGVASTGDNLRETHLR